MEMEMTPLKAIVDPTLIKARRQATMVVAVTAKTGIDVLALI